MPVTNTPPTEKAVGSFLAAAVGDALGWPFEGRSRRVQPRNAPETRSLPSEFFDWTRSGSRSEPYREPIRAGEYSDDTQLLLASARSILHGPEWWDYFAFVELPSWLLYERGGGGATKRAAQLWLAETAPWDSPRGRDRYFEAGGNGVCMRILPHVLANRNGDASDISRQIVLNGICTHGHPRALVGALLHGMTMWLSLRQEEMLEFGALTEAVYRGFPDWACFPEVATKWRGALSITAVQDYKALWDETVREIMSLLEIAKESLRLGPLSSGPETLQRMGALNPKTNGSGTITAAASLFLASRYAASPLQGMLVAATTLGSDTDTLASMAGTILGAIHGEEWLGHFASTVQDAGYIRKIAASLVAEAPVPSSGPVSKVSKKESTKFTNLLKSMNVGANIHFPDGRSAGVRSVEPMFSQSAQADLCQIQTEDGQTFAIRRLVRRTRTTKPLPKPLAVPEVENILRVGIKVFVSDLQKAREFYVHKLHFPIDKEYSTGFTVAGFISVLLSSQLEQQDFRFPRNALPSPTPCIRVANLAATASRLSEARIPMTPVTGHRSYKAFQIVDPFGNKLELFEA